MLCYICPWNFCCLKCLIRFHQGMHSSSLLKYGYNTRLLWSNWLGTIFVQYLQKEHLCLNHKTLFSQTLDFCKMSACKSDYSLGARVCNIFMEIILNFCRSFSLLFFCVSVFVFSGFLCSNIRFTVKHPREIHTWCFIMLYCRPSPQTFKWVSPLQIIPVKNVCWL